MLIRRFHVIFSLAGFYRYYTWYYDKITDFSILLLNFSGFPVVTSCNLMHDSKEHSKVPCFYLYYRWMEICAKVFCSLYIVPYHMLGCWAPQWTKCKWIWNKLGFVIVCYSRWSSVFGLLPYMGKSQERVPAKVALCFVLSFVSLKSGVLIHAWGVSLWRLPCCASIILGGSVFIVYWTMRLRDDGAKLFWMTFMSSRGLWEKQSVKLRGSWGWREALTLQWNHQFCMLFYIFPSPKHSCGQRVRSRVGTLFWKT